MTDLKISKAIYYVPEIGIEKGTDVTDELSAQIIDGRLLYNGIYNFIFPDNFVGKRKTLRVRGELQNEEFIRIYNENDKINLPYDLGMNPRNVKLQKISQQNFFGYWWKDPYIIVPAVVAILAAILTSDYWAPKIFDNSPSPITSTSTQGIVIVSKNTATSSDLRPLQPLETGKEISLLPNNVYFYSSALAIKYQLENMEIDFMKGDNDYLHSYSFEIQKSNGRYYIVGFISDEAYSNLGSVNSANSLYTVLFPESWGGARNPIAIPFDKVYTVNERTINLDANQKVDVLDIGFKEVLDNPAVHAK